MKFAIVLSSLLLLAGCSGAQLAYRNADLLIVSYVDDLVDLREAQQDVWEPLVTAAMAQHREQELPALVALLSSAEEAARGDVSRARMECLRDEAREAIARHAALVAGLAAPLLRDLEPEQLERVQQRLAERDADYTEDHLDADPERRYEARVRRFTSRIERWTGRLGARQRGMVERHVAQWPELAAGWAGYRAERQRTMFALLAAGADESTLQAFLAGWWGRQAGMPPALWQSRRQVESGVIDLLLEIQASLGSAQRRQLVEDIGDLRIALASLVPEAAIAAALRDVGCRPTGAAEPA